MIFHTLEEKERYIKDAKEKIFKLYPKTDYFYDEDYTFKDAGTTFIIRCENVDIMVTLTKTRDIFSNHNFHWWIEVYEKEGAKKVDIRDIKNEDMLNNIKMWAKS